MESGDVTNLAVLISGRGSNLKAIIDSIETGYLDRVELSAVVANKDAPGLEHAEEFGAPNYAIPRKVDGEKIPREEHDEKVMEVLNEHDVDLVCLAGYMQILTPGFVRKYENRLMNIHPSLLPAFPGTTEAQREAVEHGVKISGCTVHFATEEVDEGPIIVQSAVPVKDDDTEETLSERILEMEHIIYPKAIKMFSEDRLSVEGRKVDIERDLDAEVVTTNSVDREVIAENVRRIGVENDDIIEKFEDQGHSYVIEVRDVTPREAQIIKQEMLALGGDCATPKEAILNSLVPLDVIVIGNKGQVKGLVRSLQDQVFNLPGVAEKIENILK